jgi:hypothetical protein
MDGTEVGKRKLKKLLPMRLGESVTYPLEHTTSAVGLKIHALDVSATAQRFWLYFRETCCPPYFACSFPWIFPFP